MYQLASCKNLKMPSPKWSSTGVQAEIEIGMAVNDFVREWDTAHDDDNGDIKTCIVIHSRKR